MTDNIIYVVTDGEFDGPVPGRHSMLSFASVAVNAGGKRFGKFEAVLDPLEGAAVDPATMEFWRKNPEAYKAARENPEPPALVISRFVKWVRNLPGDPIFVSHPLALDGPWIDFYLQRFTKEFLYEGPWQSHRLFKGVPLCLSSFVAGKTGRPAQEYGNYPAEWMGHVAHTHRGIDDARGYANLLVYLMKDDGKAAKSVIVSPPARP